MLLYRLSQPYLRFSLFHITCARHKRHKSDTSATRATRVRHFGQPINRKLKFFTSWNYYKQIRFCSYHAFSINQMSGTLAIKRWFLFNFAKIVLNRHFVVGRSKNFKLFPDIFFDYGFEKIVLASLLLFSCTCYKVDLDDIQWNKVATSPARNFNSNWLPYLHFSNMINFCPNIWFIRNSKCQQLLFWRKSRQKKPQIFQFFKRTFFDVNVGVFWDFCGLSKKCIFATSPKIEPKLCYFECQK